MAFLEKIKNLLAKRFRKLIRSTSSVFKLKEDNASKNKRWPAKAVKKAERKAAELEYLLQTLGFTERAVEDLKKIINSMKNKYPKGPAVRVLACWYANQRSIEGAQRCLDLLTQAAGDDDNRDLLNATAIMKAECFEMLGDIEAGKSVISRALEAGPDPSLFLAAANLEFSIYKRLKWVNRALAFYNIPAVSYVQGHGSTTLDCIRTLDIFTSVIIELPEPVPKVTVIMSTYNTEGTIKTALDSILNQTWHNLEVLIVDDCSTDKTEEIIDEFCCRNPLFRKLKTETNSGPFVARNIALREASGYFVTCHDADDWSHPCRIELQALHLINNPEVVGNTSQQVRVTDDFKIYRRGRYGKLILENTSSFMFRRELVLQQIGYWDCVRNYSDNELNRRIRKIFGKESIANLVTGPLAFIRQHDASMTGNKFFGKHGYIMGCNKLYRDCQINYHRKASSFFYDFPQKSRPFPAPEPLWPIREVTGSERRRFDIVIASDFRTAGDNITLITKEIKILRKKKLRTALFQLSRYDLRTNLKKVNPIILDLLDGDQVQMIVYGERANCDYLIILHPPVLQERQKFIPDVEAENINIIIDQAPYDSYEPKGLLLYDIKRCQNILHECFRKNGMWYPVNPLVREALLRHHAEEISYIDLSEEDWPGISNISK